MLDVEDSVEKKIRQSADPLETALVYARIGNYIDFAALAEVSPEVILSLLDSENKDPLDPEEYGRFLEELHQAKKLVYITDNCGEIVLDKLAVRILKEQYPDLDITVLVRGFPTVNDGRSEEHTSELQSRFDLVCRLLLEKKKKKPYQVCNKQLEI